MWELPSSGRKDKQVCFVLPHLPLSANALKNFQSLRYKGTLFGFPVSQYLSLADERMRLSFTSSELMHIWIAGKWISAKERRGVDSLALKS